MTPPLFAKGIGCKVTAALSAVAMLGAFAVVGTAVASDGQPTPGATVQTATPTAEATSAGPAAADAATGDAAGQPAGDAGDAAGAAGSTSATGVAGADNAVAGTEGSSAEPSGAAASGTPDADKNVTSTPAPSADASTSAETTQSDAGMSRAAVPTPAAAPAARAATVPTVSNPAGTTMNLFDYTVGPNNDEGNDSSWNWGCGLGVPKVKVSYWSGNRWREREVSCKESQNYQYMVDGYQKYDADQDWSLTGINANHVLKFYNGKDQTDNQGVNDNNQGYQINSTNNGSRVKTGMVTSTLPENGYPQLTENDRLGTNGESLSYLFNTDPTSGAKEVYAGVNNLLQVDGDGYYVYDSTHNAAQLNLNNDGKTFSVYDDFTKTYNHGADTDTKGQFFPFNDANDLINNSTAVYNSKLNHWFGLSMTTEFVQPTGGVVTNQNGDPEDMTYEFSGDDDVWVYIDGVLVGDLGGTHEAVSLTINFQNGTVTVGGDNGYTTNLKTPFTNAGKADSTEWRENSNTFADGSEHTLKFFYLERGGWESNMKIKYNLVAPGDFTAHKTLLTSKGSQRLAAGQFKFRLTGYPLEENGQKTKAPMPGEAKCDASDVCTLDVSNEATGDVNFGDVDVSSTLYGKKFSYMIEELGPNNGNKDPVGAGNNSSGSGEDQITYDGTKYYFTSVFTKTGKTGKVEQVKTFYKDANHTTEAEGVSGASFTNYYANAGVANLEVTKHVGGQTLQGDEYAGDFSFTLTPEDNAPLPVGVTGNSETKQNGSNGKVMFSPIRFKPSDLDGKSPKTFRYEIMEVAPTGESKFNYDTKTITATVTVTYDKDTNRLSTSVSYADNDTDANNNQVFNNTLKTATAKFRVQAKIKGNTWESDADHKDNRFNYSLTYQQPMTRSVVEAPSSPRDLTVTQTTKCGKLANTVCWDTSNEHTDALEFPVPDTGSVTYSYKIVESGPTTTWGDDNGTLTDSKAEYVVTVTVDSGGNVKATMVQNKDDDGQEIDTTRAVKQIEKDSEDYLTAVFDHWPMVNLTLAKTVDNTYAGGNESTYAAVPSDWKLSARAAVSLSEHSKINPEAPEQNQTSDSNSITANTESHLVRPGLFYSLSEESNPNNPANSDFKYHDGFAKTGDWSCKSDGTTVEPWSEEGPLKGKYHFTAGSDVTCTVTNAAQPASVEWIKADASNTSQKLAGSKWKLEREKNDGTGPDVIYDNNQVTDCVIKPNDPSETVDCNGSASAGYDHSAYEGQIKLQDLTAGTYRLTETTAPAGYVTSKGYYTFTVEPGGMATQLTAEDGALATTLVSGGHEKESTGSIPVIPNVRAVSSLPLTGASTGRQWLLAGGVIGGLALLMAGAAGVWRSGRRLV